MLNLHEPIHYHLYTLRSRKPLNTLSDRTEHEGALVRIGAGVGVLHPWPEFGDLPLARQLSILSKGGFTGHIERLRVCCRLDGQARKGGYHSLMGLTCPKSHVNFPGSGPIVKVKCSTDMAAEAKRLAGIEAEKLRLDFNAQPSVDEFLAFVKALDKRTLERIDFVEDPFRADQYWWDKIQRRVPFDLACDREGVRARVAVLKPTIENPTERKERVVFTSYMDHPIGQYFAVREAAAYYNTHPYTSQACSPLAPHADLTDPEQ